MGRREEGGRGKKRPEEPEKILALTSCPSVSKRERHGTRAAKFRTQGGQQNPAFMRVGGKIVGVGCSEKSLLAISPSQGEKPPETSTGLPWPLAREGWGWVSWVWEWAFGEKVVPGYLLYRLHSPIFLWNLGWFWLKVPGKHLFPPRPLAQLPAARPWPSLPRHAQFLES